MVRLPSVLPTGMLLAAAVLAGCSGSPGQGTADNEDAGQALGNIDENAYVEVREPTRRGGENASEVIVEDGYAHLYVLVQDPSGRGIPEASVIILDTTLSAATDENGTLAFEEMPVGTYQLRIQPPFEWLRVAQVT